MASTLVTVLVLLIVFALAYWIVSILPLPAKIEWLRIALYIVLALIAIVVLLGLVGIHI